MIIIPVAINRQNANFDKKLKDKKHFIIILNLHFFLLAKIKLNKAEQ